ncbi:TPA: tryptophanase leader peptide [Proteus mirabilis]|nr:tryptophanase leader peptide [Proteus mirabilis]EKX9077067.1 tryptophanase leader peptide [Proteus mirabilis]MBG2911582.1 tryptophanase leader peptide [Proteus mirabilis]MBG2987045.1 tryptophanase leader peptide [Proteus mirabilis]MBG3032438.1 tryptophanase leader peptide [Proteus mirabilis]
MMNALYTYVNLKWFNVDYRIVEHRP